MGSILQRASFLIVFFCLVAGALGFGTAKVIYEGAPTPLTDKQKAAANTDRLLEEFYKKTRDEAPANVLGAPGSTSNEAVGVWADPLTGCQYITGGGASPVYTPRMRSTVSGMFQVCNKD